MKERVRYINIRIVSPTQLQEKEFWYTISTEVKRLFGTLGAAEVGLFLSYFDEKNQGGVFRSSHKFVHRVKGALCFINSQKNISLFVYSEAVTGSLKKAKGLLYHPKHIDRYGDIKRILLPNLETSFNDENLPV
ncbi:MAG: Rpp14/Pop5 family protein [Candidatus Hodarchaeota archaeon]